MTSYLPPKHNNSKFNVADFDYQNDYLTSQSVTKYTVGLGQVDNTSDANKPISTATAAALATKQSILNTSNKLNPAYISNGIDAAQISTGLISNAEFNTLDGISIASTIQNQLDATTTALAGKQSTLNTLNKLNPAYISNGIDAAQVSSGLISNAEFNTLDGISIASTIQNQLDATTTALAGKQSTLNTLNKLNPGYISNGIDAAQISTGLISNAEFNTLDGITTSSTIQNQLDAITGGTTFVKTTGNQSIAGIKSFTNTTNYYATQNFYNQFATNTLQWVDYATSAAMGLIYCSSASYRMFLQIQQGMYQGIQFGYTSVGLFNMAIDGVSTAIRGFISDNIVNNFSYISPTLKSVPAIGSTLTTNTSLGNDLTSGSPCVLSSSTLVAIVRANQTPVWTCVAPIGFNGNLNFKCAVSFGTYNPTIVNCSTSMGVTLLQQITNMRLIIYRDGYDYRNISIPILNSNNETTQIGFSTVGKTGNIVFKQFISDYQVIIPVAGDSSVAHTYDFVMQYDLNVSWTISASGIDGAYDLYFNTVTSTHSSTLSPFGTNIVWLNSDGTGYSASALTSSATDLTTTGYTYTNNLNANALTIGSVYLDSTTIYFNAPTNTNAINSTGTTLKLYANNVNSVSIKQDALEYTGSLKSTYSSLPSLSTNSVGYTYWIAITGGQSCTGSASKIIATITSVPIGVYAITYQCNFYTFNALPMRIKTAIGTTASGRDIAGILMTQVSVNDYQGCGSTSYVNISSTCSMYLNVSLNPGYTCLTYTEASNSSYFQVMKIA